MENGNGFEVLSDRKTLKLYLHTQQSQLIAHIPGKTCAIVYIYIHDMLGTLHQNVEEANFGPLD